jgi:AraC family transcriptional regulator of adaptative response/methylated-DNA-[protein]-cysteine methyltransferase
MVQSLSRAEMARAFRRRDANYDGVFYPAVKTTGIFCRPSCGARKPLPKNVDFFATAREAVFAGYRPCKRCSPMAASGDVPTWVTPLLSAIERNPSERLPDAQIRTLGIDPARVRRFFLRTYGMTFHAYCRSRRLGEALEQIRKGTKLDDVTLGYGYASHSGFRDAFAKTFGTSPGKASTTESILVSWVECPLGPLIAGATQKRLVLLEFTDRRMLEAQFETLRRRFKLPIVPGDNDVLKKLRKELAEYFNGKRKRFTVPLEYPGSTFQRKAWDGLLGIPYGTTVSYEALAKSIGVPRAQRAVGHANGLNRIGILIPCHRVVNKDGRLGGYGGGLWRKQALLALEQGRRSERLTVGDVPRDEPSRTYRGRRRGQETSPSTPHVSGEVVHAARSLPSGR